MNPVTGTRCVSVDTGVNANLELVDKFCYIGEMLWVTGYGDADAAVENRIRIGWINSGSSSHFLPVRIYH